MRLLQLIGKAIRHRKDLFRKRPESGAFRDWLTKWQRSNRELYGSKSDKRPPENPNQQQLNGVEETEHLERLKNNASKKKAPQRNGKKKGPKANNYILKRTDELLECFKHKPSRIDNNLAENALRSI